MIRRIVLTLGILTLLSALPCFQVSANSASHFNVPDVFAEQSYGDGLLAQTNRISTKRGEKYDESNDPALRKGTENWEQSQGGFWVIPAIVLGIVFVALFFNRE